MVETLPVDERLTEALPLVVPVAVDDVLSKAVLDVRPLALAEELVVAQRLASTLRDCDADAVEHPLTRPLSDTEGLAAAVEVAGADIDTVPVQGTDSESLPLEDPLEEGGATDALAEVLDVTDTVTGADSQPLEESTGDTLGETLAQRDAATDDDVQPLAVCVAARPLELTDADPQALAAELAETDSLAPAANEPVESADAVDVGGPDAVRAPDSELGALAEGCRDVLSRPLAEELTHPVPLAVGPATDAEPGGDAVSEVTLETLCSALLDGVAEVSPDEDSRSEAVTKAVDEGVSVSPENDELGDIAADLEARGDALGEPEKEPQPLADIDACAVKLAVLLTEPDNVARDTVAPPLWLGPPPLPDGEREKPADADVATLAVRKTLPL